jgi:hypothetical protein
MCLKYDKELTTSVLKRFEKGPIKAYKVLRIDKKDVCSSYSHLAETTLWEAGWNESNRKNVQLTAAELGRKTITKGFHVFLTREGAREDFSYFNTGSDSIYAIVPVYGYAEHFVAAGFFEPYSYGGWPTGKKGTVSSKTAVFKKLLVKEEDIEKARNKRR